jgi:PAP2 superfamily
VTEGRERVETESGRRLRWWREVLYIGVFYLAYSAVRNTFGSAGGAAGASARIAFQHARDVIRIQHGLHLWFEPQLQHWYLGLPARGGIRIWNVYYGTAHFVVTVVALIWLFRRDRDRYSTWRNTLAYMTALALIGFAAYSLMPPRLLDDNGRFGACRGQVEACHGYDIQDTLVRYGALWSFDSGAMAKVSNQYAAMPSMHTGWSTWCALVMWPLVRRRWAKVLVALYPVATVFCILVTGNHYWLDAVGGLAAFGVGWFLGSRTAAWNERRLQRRLAAAEATTAPATSTA